MKNKNLRGTFSKNKKSCQEIRSVVASKDKNIINLFNNVSQQKNNFKIANTATRYHELLHKVLVSQPNIVIADLKIHNIYQAISMIANFKSFECKIIVVNNLHNKFVKKALNNGAHGYILNTYSLLEVINIIESIEKTISIKSKFQEEITISEIEILEATRETAEINKENKTNIFLGLLPNNLKKALPNIFNKN